VEDTVLEDEPGLDGSDDDVQFDGGALYAMRVSTCVPYGRRVTQGCDRAGN
jgi:hypothetical protein